MRTVVASALCGLTLLLPMAGPEASLALEPEPALPIGLALEASTDAEGAVSLRARITHLDSNVGRVAVALFDSADGFPDQRRALRGKLSTIRDRRASVVFHGLPRGVYAVAVLHDENENNEMDFNFLGMPLEGYGFSNDASATFGPPSFSDAAFRLRAERSVISIKTRYFSL